MMKNNWLSVPRTPILVEYLDSIAGGDEWHNMFLL
jgi:hypothetical protein